MRNRGSVALRLILLFCVLCLTVTATAQPRRTAPDTGPPIPFPNNVTLPLRIGVSVYVNRISKINEVTNTFEGQVDLLYHWYDPRLAFDVRETGTNRLEFGDEAAVAKLATIWNPRVKVTNLIEKESQAVPGLFIYADGRVEYIQRIKGTFETKFALSAFPFDTQSLVMVLLSSKYNADQVDLVQDQEDIDASGLDPDLKIAGWTLQDISFKTAQLRAWNGESLRQLEARVAVQRVPNAILALILTPFLLTLLVPSILTFVLKLEVPARLSAWGGSILSLVALNFTFSVRYPWLSGDSFVSQLITSGHVYQLISIILTLTLFNPAVTERRSDPFLVAELISFLRWTMPLGLFAVLIVKLLLTAYAW